MKKTLLILSITLSSCSVAIGQIGVLDSNYNLNGIVTTSTSLDDDIGYSIASQSDGKIIIVGSSDDDADYTIIRYNTDGSFDNSFGVNGVVTHDINGKDDEATDIILQPNGQFIIVGTTIDNWSDAFFIARYNANGSIDNSFGTSGITLITDEDAQAHSVSLQTNGKILICGDFSGFNHREVIVARLNVDGSRDSTFGTNGFVTTTSSSSLYGMDSEIQPDGKIIIGGYTSTSPSNFALIRYNSDGTLDNSFGTMGIVTTDVNSNSLDNAYAVLLQSDGKILLGGYSDNGTAQYDFSVVRYNTDGTIDITYGTNGIVLIDVNNNSTDYGRGMALLPNGKLIIAGYAHNAGADFALVVLLSDGSLDTSFGTNGKVFTDIGGSWDKAYSIALTPDNKIVLGGYSNTNGDDEFTTARYISEFSIGIIDLSLKSNSLMIFPNPILKSATLEYELSNKENLSMDVINIKGEIVKSIFNNSTKQKGLHQEKINLSQLSKGTYILRLYNKNSQTNIKIIKK